MNAMKIALKALNMTADELRQLYRQQPVTSLYDMAIIELANRLAECECPD